jgi:hypothetical protein
MAKDDDNKKRKKEKAKRKRERAKQKESKKAAKKAAKQRAGDALVKEFLCPISHELPVEPVTAEE